MKSYTYPSLLILTLTLAACGGGSSGTGAATAAADAGPISTASTSEAAAPAAIGTATPTDSTGTTPAPSAPGSNTSPAPAPAPSPSPSPSPAPAPAPAPSNVTQIIEYYGDSTVWGYNPQGGGQVATPPPTVFAQTLLAAGRKVDVRNEGVSATTACDLLNGKDGKHPAWSTQMAGSKAGYVLVNFAINDEWKYDLNTYKGCLRSLAQTAKQHGKQMIFETPNPTRDSGSWGLDVYVNAMKAVATEQQVPVIDQYKYLTDYLSGQSPYTICPDGLHPTQAVYIMKGKFAASAFMNLFR